MLQVLPERATPFVGGGPFRIRPMRPGLTEGRPMADPVIGPLSRVDHASSTSAPSSRCISTAMTKSSATCGRA